MGFSPEKYRPPTASSVEIAPAPSGSPTPEGSRRAAGSVQSGPGHDKWTLASQLQKSIRHGHPWLAAATATALDAMDPAYLRYRMAVIAVEDVAAGSPDEVLSAFASGWRKADIQSRGGLAFLAATAAAWAGSIKDRTPCDWMASTHWRTAFEASHGSWEQLSVPDAVSMALDERLTWWQRGLAAWRAAGTHRFPSAHLPTVEGDWPAWMEACRSAYGASASDLMRCGQSQREPHPVFLGMALGARVSSAPPATLERPPIPPEAAIQIGPFLSAALDKHTALGRRALTGFLNQQAPLLSPSLRALPHSELKRLTGALWFESEGGLCDRQWSYGLSVRIRAETRERLLASFRVSESDARVLADPIARHRARSLAARQPFTSSETRAPRVSSLSFSPFPGVPV